MTTSWTNDIQCTINGIDVSDCLLRMNIAGSQSNAIVTGTLEFNKRGLDTLVTVTNAMQCVVTRKYVVTVDGVPSNVDQVIFRGYCKTPEESRGRTTVQVQDWLKRLSDSEVNKTYGTEDVPVDLSEIFYDIATSAQIYCTYNVANATIQKSGKTTSGMTFSHVNGFTAAKQIAEALGWQFYYHPEYDAVMLEPRDYRSTNKPVYSNGDWGGVPSWTKDVSQLCNQVTVIPAARTNNTDTMTYKFSQDVHCSSGGMRGILVPKDPNAIISVIWTSGGGGGITAGTTLSLYGNKVTGDVGTARNADTFHAYLFDPDKAFSPYYNLWMVNNTYSGTTAYHDFYAGDTLAIKYFWTGPVPQVFKNSGSINVNGLVAKTITRTDMRPDDVPQFAQEYLGRFSQPLEQVSIPAVHTPLKLPWLGQLCDIVDAQNGKTRSNMAVVSIELNWPGKKDTIVLGELNAITADYTTGLEERIKNLETTGLSNDYTQGQYTPLSGVTGNTGSGGTPTGSIAFASKTVKSDGSTAVAGLGISNQGKMFYANGYYYVFWFDGSYVVYSSSADLDTWATPVNVVGEASGSYFTCLADTNNKLHYVRGNGSQLIYRRGTIGTNGVITWDAAELDALAGGSAVTIHSITLASDGHILYSYQRDGQVWVNKVAYSTSLAADSGYPKQITSGTTHNYASKIVTSDTGAWYVAYADDAGSTAIRGRYWDTSALASEETCSLGNISANYRFSLVSDSSHQCHLTYNKAGGDYRAMYRMRSANGVWDTAEYDVPGAAVSYLTIPFITRGASGQQYVFWLNSPTAGQICYRGHATDGTWDSSTTVAYTESAGLPSPDCGIVASTNYFDDLIGLAYFSDAASPYTIKVLKMSFDGTSSTGGTGTPSTTGRVAVASGVLTGPDGNAVQLRTVNDSATWCGLANARGGSYVPDSTLSCPVTAGGASVDTSSAESVATFAYRYAKRLQADGFNGVRIGAHTCWGLDALYTAWRSDSTKFDLVTRAMAQGFEAAGFYFQLCMSGFAESLVSEGGNGYENRQLLTTMTTAGSHIAATGHLTDNILHKDSTSYNNFADFCVHVGDLLANFPHFVALELSNEPSNWRQCPVYWTAQYGNDYSTGGAVETAMIAWSSGLAAKIRSGRTKSWNITNGWTLLAGPPFFAQATVLPMSNPGALHVRLNNGMDIAGGHIYHFSPVFQDTSTSTELSLLTAVNSACKTAGLPFYNDEWGSYDSQQVYVSSIASDMNSIGMHWACIVPPSRNAIGSDALPSGWASLGA